MASGTSSRRDVTAFDYVAEEQWDFNDVTAGAYQLRQDGGIVSWYYAGQSSVTWGDVYGIDTSADNQAIQQPTSNLARAIGIVVGQVANGRPVFGANAFASEFGTITAGSTKLFILSRGKTWAVADGAISRGDIVTASSTTAGRITSNNAPATGTTLGRALTAATLAGQQVLISINK